MRPVVLFCMAVLIGIFSNVRAQNQSDILYSLGQLSGKTYCFDANAGRNPNDPGQLSNQSDRDSIRSALGTTGLSEAISGRCDYLVRYDLRLDQYQDIEMQPVSAFPGPYWGGYYGPGIYPGWGGTVWVPVAVIRKRYVLTLDLYSKDRPGHLVYRGFSSSVLNGQDDRMIVSNMVMDITRNFPANNQLNHAKAR